MPGYGFAFMVVSSGGSIRGGVEEGSVAFILSGCCWGDGWENFVCRGDIVFSSIRPPV